jgi:hypothetical protein
MTELENSPEILVFVSRLCLDVGRLPCNNVFVPAVCVFTSLFSYGQRFSE